MLRFYIEGEKVVQSEEPGGETEFDPRKWGAFTRGSLVVRAVRIPRPFKIGATLCQDGYLVFDGRLKAVAASTFSLDYAPLSESVAL